MALKKSDSSEEKVRIFDEFLEAREVFENPNEDKEKRLAALEYIVDHKEIYYTLRMLSELFKENKIDDHIYIDFAFANFDHKPKREEDFDEIFKMLKSDNAYLRNAAITFLQTYGKEAQPFLEKLLNNEDKDVRIFAVNILGDVNFEESLDMLRYLLLKEKDINAMMTAVDYMGEIGTEDDIPLLEALKKEHEDEPYVAFGIDTAISRIKGE